MKHPKVNSKLLKPPKSICNPSKFSLNIFAFFHCESLLMIEAPRAKCQNCPLSLLPGKWARHGPLHVEEVEGSPEENHYSAYIVPTVLDGSESWLDIART